MWPDELEEPNDELFELEKRSWFGPESQMALLSVYFGALVPSMGHIQENPSPNLDELGPVRLSGYYMSLRVQNRLGSLAKFDPCCVRSWPKHHMHHSLNILSVPCAKLAFVVSCHLLEYRFQFLQVARQSSLFQYEMCQKVPW